MRRSIHLFACAAFLATGSTALADGDSENFASRINALSPDITGLEIEVVEGDDALELSNETKRTILVRGYDGEPYLRISPNGVVEVNRSSPAAYLNEDRYATQAPPPGVSRDARPRWKVVARNGIYEWHDHRIHWMSPDVVPPQVKDESERTKVFDWKVPLEVGDERVKVSGTLTWLPSDGDDGGGVPAAILIAAAALLLVGLALIGRRLRQRPGGGDGDGEGRPPPEEPSEAW